MGQIRNYAKCLEWSIVYLKGCQLITVFTFFPSSLLSAIPFYVFVLFWNVDGEIAMSHLVHKTQIFLCMWTMWMRCKIYTCMPVIWEMSGGKLLVDIPLCHSPGGQPSSPSSRPLCFIPDCSHSPLSVLSRTAFIHKLQLSGHLLRQLT